MLQFFIDENETMQIVLGKDAYDNYCRTGIIGNGFCVVSDKRLYFKGNCYYSCSGRFKKTIANRIADLYSFNYSGYVTQRVVPPIISIIILIFAIITGSIGGYKYYNSASYVTYRYDGFTIHPIDEFERNLSYGFFIASFVMMVIFLICIIKKRHLFQIVFDGGKFAYKTSTLQGDDIYEVQKKLDITKENALDNRRKAQVVQKQENISLVDELKKYSELLQAGAITQEEYEQVKRRILNI